MRNMGMTYELLPTSNEEILQLDKILQNSRA